MLNVKISWQELIFLFFMCPLGGRMEKKPCLKMRLSLPPAGCGRILSGARTWSVQWMIKVWKFWEVFPAHTYATDLCASLFWIYCASYNKSSSTCRLGIWNNPPPRPPAKVLGSIREDVPHQPPETLDPTPPQRYAENGGAQKSTSSVISQVFVFSQRNNKDSYWER